MTESDKNKIISFVTNGLAIDEKSLIKNCKPSTVKKILAYFEKLEKEEKVQELKDFEKNLIK